MLQFLNSQVKLIMGGYHPSFEHAFYRDDTPKNIYHQYEAIIYE